MMVRVRKTWFCVSVMYRFTTFELLQRLAVKATGKNVCNDVN